MIYAVYYRNRKLTPATPIRELAESDMRRLAYSYLNLEVRGVG